MQFLVENKEREYCNFEYLKLCNDRKLNELYEGIRKMLSDFKLDFFECSSKLRTIWEYVTKLLFNHYEINFDDKSKNGIYDFSLIIKKDAYFFYNLFFDENKSKINPKILLNLNSEEKNFKEIFYPKNNAYNYKIYKKSENVFINKKEIRFIGLKVNNNKKELDLVLDKKLEYSNLSNDDKDNIFNSLFFIKGVNDIFSINMSKSILNIAHHEITNNLKVSNSFILDEIKEEIKNSINFLDYFLKYYIKYNNLMSEDNLNKYKINENFFPIKEYEILNYIGNKKFFYAKEYDGKTDAKYFFVEKEDDNHDNQKSTYDVNIIDINDYSNSNFNIKHYYIKYVLKHTEKYFFLNRKNLNLLNLVQKKNIINKIFKKVQNYHSDEKAIRYIDDFTFLISIKNQDINNLNLVKYFNITLIKFDYVKVLNKNVETINHRVKKNIEDSKGFFDLRTLNPSLSKILDSLSEKQYSKFVVCEIFDLLYLILLYLWIFLDDKSINEAPRNFKKVFGEYNDFIIDTINKLCSLLNDIFLNKIEENDANNKFNKLEKEIEDLFINA